MQYFITGWGGLANLFGPKPEDKGKGAKPTPPSSEPKKLPAAK
jgi:hypothetical protein